jgi:hypothetical protein
MNPWEHHGIDHTSPSSCNLFAAAPAKWCVEYLLRKKAPGSASMYAGVAGEAGIVHGLINPAAKDEECIAAGMAEWRRKMALSGDPRREKYDEIVPLFIARGLEELRPYGVPTAVQKRVSRKVEDLLVPINGVLDVLWGQHGILTDIKTTQKMPSEIRPSHARQVSLYKAEISDNLDARITYITDKKVATYALENYRQHLSALEQIALTQQRFLSKSKDPHELCGLIFPDYENYYWNDPVSRSHGLAVWGV